MTKTRACSLFILSLEAELFAQTESILIHLAVPLEEVKVGLAFTKWEAPPALFGASKDAAGEIVSCASWELLISYRSQILGWLPSTCCFR